MGILNLVTYIPLIGALVMLFFVRQGERHAPSATRPRSSPSIDFIASLYLWFNFDPHGTGGTVPVPRDVRTGFRRSASQYDFGVDGISLCSSC